MLLVYVPRLTNRLGYTLNVLLKHLLHADFSITTDEDLFLRHGDAKFCYGPRRIGDSLHVKSCQLLLETSIEEQEPRPFQRDGQWMLFPVYGHGLDVPFDLLAATFYMVSHTRSICPTARTSTGASPRRSTWPCWPASRTSLWWTNGPAC